MWGRVARVYSDVKIFAVWVIGRIEVTPSVRVVVMKLPEEGSKLA